MNASAILGGMRSRSLWAALLAGVLGSVLLAAATRTVIHHPPMYDELLHVLAARGVQATGEPVIADGVYGRSELFTRIVATSFHWAGDSLASARLPALLGAVLLVFVTGAWVTRQADLIAGTTAGALLALSESSISLSGFARFYTLHALLILFAYIGAYEACRPGRSGVGRTAWALVAIAAIPIAWHLQVTTLIAVGGIVLAVAGLLAMEHREALLRELRRRPSIYGLLAIALGAAGVFLAWGLEHYGDYGKAPFWAEGRSDRVGFYFQLLGKEWPLFWPLLPLAVIAAAWDFRRFGLFCVLASVSSLFVHSLAAAKAGRYIYYLLPLLCVIIGCGVSVTLRLLAGWLKDALPARLTQISALVAVILLGIVAVNSQELRQGARFVVGKGSWQDLGMFASESNWRPALPLLRPYLELKPTVLVSSGVKGIYYLGDYDLELNASTVLETESLEEFGRDYRTGRHAIGSRESLARAIDKSRGALVVVDQDKLGREFGVPAAAVDLLQSRCDALDLPVEARVAAWFCSPD